ncbi:MAG: hypothetical protein NC301_07145 [Bacteroides sp.]|nr:hypothetical protein [Bacteroides sp.]MCM1379147.1 hypothetical protein [Bacteroides sp.]
MGSKTKKLLLSVVFLLAVLGGVYAYSVWQLTHLNVNPQFQEIEGNLISRFDAGSNSSISPVSGNIVNFDLGSRHSFINRRSAHRLDSLGWPVKFYPTLIYTVDTDGRYRLYTQKVVLDVTLPNPELPDSIFIIHDVELLVVDNDQPNVFGMDLLRNVVIEHLWPEGTVSFYKEVPEGYYPVCNITVHDSPFGNYVGATGRASVKLAVNDEPARDYFFDTCGNMQGLEVVEPRDNMHSATSKIDIDSVTGLPTQRRCRVSFGNRMRFSNVVYCDTLHTDEYSVNPLVLFDQDFLIDMKGRKLMIHKTRQI